MLLRVIIARLRWAGHVARICGEERRIQGKPAGSRALGRPKDRWEDNIKMVLQEEECGVMDWMELVQERGRGPCECGNEPSGSIKCGEFLD